MELEQAIRYSEILLGFALLLQSFELVRSLGIERKIALLHIPLSVLLMVGFYPLVIESLLLVTSFLLIKRYRGPYNGGSDTVTLLLLLCLCLANLAPSRLWQEVALGYLALQLIISYFQAGWVKLVNPEWRTGKALHEVFALTAYPVSESLRGLAKKTRLLFVASWLVIMGELLFPLALLNSTLLVIALFCAAFFHFANAMLFGLNRFFWGWLATYPVIIWFQQRLLEVL